MRWRTVLRQYSFLLVTCLLTALEAVPIDIDKTKVKNAPPVDSAKIEPPDTGLYYDEYLKQVIDVLETDTHFREKLQKADIEEIKSGRLSRELDLVSHHVRTKLDELKRQEVGRLRMLIKAKLDSLQDTGIDHHALLKQFDHLNHLNPDRFESTDLDMLIKAATSDLEHYDKTRHEEFKKYEMMKEHERREYLKTLNEEKRKEEESKFEEMKKKHENHPKVNHPGSKDQLKEVWEETDGLDPNDFDPKTFFKLHDVNNDGFLDEQELEALFTKELEKVYDPKNEEDDMVEMEEERLRMREHVMNEVDANKDRLVTLEEFLKATEKKEFLEPDSWETLDQQQFFTEEELREYENLISLQENELQKKADELQKQKEELQRQHDQLEAQKLEYHQVLQQMEQKKLQQEISPSGPGGDSKFEPPVQNDQEEIDKEPELGGTCLKEEVKNGVRREMSRSTNHVTSHAQRTRPPLSAHTPGCPLRGALFLTPILGSASSFSTKKLTGQKPPSPTQVPASGFKPYMAVGAVGRATGLRSGGFLRLVLLWVLSLTCRLPTAAFLEVEIAKKPQIVLLNDNATIECKIPGSSQLNIQTMGVTWFWKSQENETDVKVFEFFGNHQEAFRSGAIVSLQRLRQRDASLQLPGVQLREAGQYRCEVVITPEKAQGAVWLQVVACPVCNLFEESVKDNEDRHILCKSSGFYPKDINITWIKWTQEDPEYVEVSEGIITDPAIQNEDGTFNITSHLRLKPSPEHSMTIYQCMVRHITLPTSWKSNFTSPWKKSEKSASSSIVGPLTALITGTTLLILHCFP